MSGQTRLYLEITRTDGGLTSCTNPIEEINFLSERDSDGLDLVSVRERVFAP